MRKLRMAFCSAAVLLSAIPTALAQNPANEHNCPAQTNTGAAALEAEPPYVGSGIDGFSRNQSLCLPQLAPVGTSGDPLAFIVQGVEPAGHPTFRRATRWRSSFKGWSLASA